MPNGTPGSGIRDNHYCGWMGDLLNLHICNSSRMAARLQPGRGFKTPKQKDQAQDTTDFELVTWLVIKRIPTDL